MKNAAIYVKKMKKFLAAIRKNCPAGKAQPDLAPLERLAMSVLLRNVTFDKAADWLKTLKEEFVDFNEMRVAPAKDITDLLGVNSGEVRAKAEMLTAGLDKLFEQGKDLSFNYLMNMAKREVPGHLREKLGLDSYAEAYLMLTAFDSPAVPIDYRMAERIKDEGAAPPEATIDEIRGLVEKSIAGRDARGTYEALMACAAAARKSSKRAGETAKHKSKPAAKAGAKATKGKNRRRS